MITIGILLFPQVEELDFVGPFEVLSYVNKLLPDSTRVLLLAESLEPLTAFNGMRVLPDVALKECPALDVLVVPGGQGRLTAMKDAAVLDFIKKQAATVRYMTSVCTGAFLLARAGLLQGKQATTYHTAFDELAAYSVEVRKRKVVRDGNIITAGGVSSGLELGLYLILLLFGETISQQTADRLEYAINVRALGETENG